MGKPTLFGRVTEDPKLWAVPCSAQLQVIVALPLESVPTSETVTAMPVELYGATTVYAAFRILLIIVVVIGLLLLS